MNCGLVTPRICGLPHWDQQRIFGTWDFKWPKEKKIRVAFQRLPESRKDEKNIGDGEFEALIAKVASLARTWTKAGNSSITFQFLTDPGQWLPAPLPGANRGQSPRGEKYVNYDVLVSLAPLPIPVSYDVKVAIKHPDVTQRLWERQRVSVEAGSKRPLEIVLQTAQLGRFALRCDYGVPTVYLGQPRRDAQPNPVAVKKHSELKAPPDGAKPLQFEGQGLAVGKLEGFTELPLASAPQTLREYFGLPDDSDRSRSSSPTKEFESAVVHEFGHVLGIPHLHQSPLLDAEQNENVLWKSDRKIIDLLREGVGVTFDKAFVDTQIVLPFPSTAGADENALKHRCGALFSDWQEPQVDDLQRPVDSVMAHPFMGALFRQPRDPLLVRFVEPQPADLAFLRAMY